MRAITFLIASIFAVEAAAAVLPERSSPLEYHYFKADGTEIALQNHSLPITVGGVPIGTEELPSTGAPGTFHHLSFGHHFGHDGWAINGSSWQYLGNIKDRRASLTRKVMKPDSGNFNRTVEASGPEALERRGSSTFNPRADDEEYHLFEVDGRILETLYTRPSDHTRYYFESDFISWNIRMEPPFRELSWWASGPDTELIVDLWSTNDVSGTPIASFVELVDDVLNLLFDAFEFFDWF